MSKLRENIFFDTNYFEIFLVRSSLQFSDLQSQFSMPKIIQIFRIKNKTAMVEYKNKQTKNVNPIRTYFVIWMKFITFCHG